jgi:arylformamidase
VLYRDFATQEELDAQYDLSRSVPDVEVYSEFYIRESERLRAEREHLRGVRFGPTLAEYMDVYPAGGDAPVLIYVHGGYWARRTAEEFGFVARGPGDHGVATVVTNYALCPHVTIDEQVRQTRAAVAWTYHNARSFGGDPDRIHLTGHSAGAHLVAVALTTDWEGAYGLPRDFIGGATVISGIFDLAPLPYTFLQPKLQLTWDQVLRNSPALHLPDAAPPLLAIYGSLEPPELARQTEEFLSAWREHGLGAESVVLEGKNHYDVVDGFLDPESALLLRIFERMGV